MQILLKDLEELQEVLFLQIFNHHKINYLNIQNPIRKPMIDKIEYNSCLKYIQNYWSRLICYHPKDRQLHLGLPNRYVTPSRYIFKKDQFYWDTYFVILGLVRSKRVALAKGMVDNFVYLFNRFGIIPMRNRYYNLGTSQIPFLTSMALEIYDVDKDKAWLKKVFKIAQMELEKYWMNPKLTEKHIVYKGLSRYCDHYITHLGAEHESGWDMTSRFNNHCLDYLPIDLNSCLYKYEVDLAEFYLLQENKSKYEYFNKKAQKRKRQITKLMWNKKKNFFFDYNFKHKQQSDFLSVAGFYPLWAKLATPKQAQQIREHALQLFECECGIVNTQQNKLSDEPKQHDYPNGWPQQQYIVIKGLLNYGFRQDAERLARKWLDMNARIFTETGKFWEKHNVVDGKVGDYNSERYSIQHGFAWTNSVFVWLVKEFGE